MPHYKYWTVEAYAKYAKRRRTAISLSIGAWCVASFIAAFSQVFLKSAPAHTPTPAPRTGIIFGNVVSYEDTPCSTETATAADIALLAEAKAEWEVALHRPLATPLLKRSTCWQLCNSNPGAFACAKLNDYEIILQSKALAGANTDLRTILMHEVGHLLGVPHIEDDSLMGPAYTVKLRHPTPFAIAIAEEVSRKTDDTSRKSRR